MPQSGADGGFARKGVDRTRFAAQGVGNRLDRDELAAAAPGEEHFAHGAGAEALENVEAAEGHRLDFAREHRPPGPSPRMVAEGEAAVELPKVLARETI